LTAARRHAKEAGLAGRTASRRHDRSAFAALANAEDQKMMADNPNANSISDLKFDIKESWSLATALSCVVKTPARLPASSLVYPITARVSGSWPSISRPSKTERLENLPHGKLAQCLGTTSRKVARRQDAYCSQRDVFAQPGLAASPRARRSRALDRKCDNRAATSPAIQVALRIPPLQSSYANFGSSLPGIDPEGTAPTWRAPIRR
jgi:hypothetical protein